MKFNNEWKLEIRIFTFIIRSVLKKAKKLVNLPWEDEEEDGTSSGATGNKASTETEASCNAVKHRLADQQQSKRRQAVHRRRIGVVNAESQLVVLIRHHFRLKTDTSSAPKAQLAVDSQAKRERYLATTSFSTDSENESDEVKSDNDGQNRDGNCHARSSDLLSMARHWVHFLCVLRSADNP